MESDPDFVMRAPFPIGRARRATTKLLPPRAVPAAWLARTAILAGVVSAAGCDAALDPPMPDGARLEFADRIGHVVADRPLPPIEVRAVDERGSIIEHIEGEVHIDLRENASGAALIGQTSAPLASGVARFEDLVVDRPASGLVLEASFESEGRTFESNAFRALEAPDLIRVHNVSTAAHADRIGLLVDGRSSGEFENDMRLSATADSPYAEVVLERAEESNEVVVFQNGRAPGIVADAAWTEGVDTIDVTLPDPLTLPVTVWFVAGGDFAEMRPQIEQAFEGAQTLYDVTATGLDIVSELEIVDASGFPKADEYSRTPFEGDDIVNDIGRREGRINVYGVESVGWARGLANHPTASFYITAQGWSGRIIAHEFGHLFALRHTDAVDGFGEIGNLMSGGYRFTHGQIFYLHFADRSAVNRTYGLRTELARDCPSEVNDPGDPRCVPLNTVLW